MSSITYDKSYLRVNFNELWNKIFSVSHLIASRIVISVIGNQWNWKWASWYCIADCLSHLNTNYRLDGCWYWPIIYFLSLSKHIFHLKYLHLYILLYIIYSFLSETYISPEVLLSIYNNKQVFIDKWKEKGEFPEALFSAFMRPKILTYKWLEGFPAQVFIQNCSVQLFCLSGKYHFLCNPYRQMHFY